MKGIYKPTLWGGQHLREFGKRDLPAAPIGEVWETADQTAIGNGPLAGCTLAGVMRQWGVSLLGERSANSPRFPLLVKLIDANAPLSVQVHPNDTQAAELEGEPWGKTEAWHILKAAPKAEIVLGARDCSDIETLRQHIGAGTMEHRLNHLPVSAGDTVYIPAGRIHALGKGLVAYEVQQQSDITYRLYDWNRRDTEGNSRELHIDKALQVTALDSEPCVKETPSAEDCDRHRRATLVASPYFVLEKLDADSDGQIEARANGATFSIYTVTGGGGQLRWGKQQTEALALGDTLIIPAALGDYQIEVGAGGIAVLRASVPERTSAR
jgi:mannose-6-phosphate isomerase